MASIVSFHIDYKLLEYVLMFHKSFRQLVSTASVMVFHIAINDYSVFSIQLFDNSFNLMILFNVGFQFQASIFILPLTKKNGFTFNRIHSFAFQFTSFVSISPFCFYLNSNSKTMNIKIEDKYNN